MTASPRIARSALFVMIVGAIFWLGAVNIRAMIGNDILKTGDVGV